MNGEPGHVGLLVSYSSDSHSDTAITAANDDLVSSQQKAEGTISTGYNRDAASINEVQMNGEPGHVGLLVSYSSDSHSDTVITAANDDLVSSHHRAQMAEGAISTGYNRDATSINDELMDGAPMGSSPHPMFKLEVLDQSLTSIECDRMLGMTAQTSTFGTLHQVREYILNAKSIILFAGAGISVAAGIPPFRGVSGIYNNKYGELSGNEPFSLDTIRSKPLQFWKFHGQLYEKCNNAKPTLLHHWVFSLMKCGKVLHLFDQNIDMIFDRMLLQHPELQECHHLMHGSYSKVRCVYGTCWINALGSDYYEAMRRCDSEILHCSGTTTRSGRQVKCKTSMIIPGLIYLKDVVQTKNWSMIKIATNAIKCDIFLVIGSSLAIPEFRAYVNDFIKKHPESRVIVVNTVAQEESPHYNQIKVDHWITLEADAFVSGIHLNSNPFSGLVNNINEFKQLTEKWHMGHNGNTDPGIREITQL